MIMPRLLQNSKMVFHVGTDYSGMRTFEQILVQLLYGVKSLMDGQVTRKGVNALNDVPEAPQKPCIPTALYFVVSCWPEVVPDIRFHHATEILASARETLLQCKDLYRPTHVFGDILDRLPPEQLRRVRAEMQKASNSNEQQAVSVMKSAEVIIKQAATVFSGGAYRSYCHVHGAACLVPMCRGGGEKTRKRKSNELFLAAAGTTCVAWSSFGKRQKRGHQAMAPFHCWALERGAVAEDIIFHENSEHFPVELITETFGKRFLTFAVVISPEDRSLLPSPHQARCRSKFTKMQKY